MPSKFEGLTVEELIAVRAALRVAASASLPTDDRPFQALYQAAHDEWLHRIEMKIKDAGSLEQRQVTGLDGLSNDGSSETEVHDSFPRATSLSLITLGPSVVDGAARSDSDAL